MRRSARQALAQQFLFIFIVDRDDNLSARQTRVRPDTDKVSPASSTSFDSVSSIVFSAMANASAGSPSKR